ncbi:hypothetical protein HN587_04140 [Candidatus Woesearchaeota archaeon]|jgi:small subunit ribosomal protein S3Ae|nr:hypothetical protein [Candidatus Woesearchaeota archaeon]
MAKGKKVTKTVDKWKKKKWFKVLASKEFNEYLLGETPTNDPSLIIGKTLKTSLMTLTGNMQKQNTNVVFEVDQVKGETAYTQVKKFEVTSAAIKRKVRRQKDKLEISFICLTKDDVLIRIKPLLITNSKTTSQVKTALRKMAVASVLALVRTLDYRTLVMDLVSTKFQKALRNTLKKTHPIRMTEIRVMARLKDDPKKAKDLAEKLTKIISKKPAKPKPVRPAVAPETKVVSEPKAVPEAKEATEAKASPEAKETTEAKAVPEVKEVSAETTTDVSVEAEPEKKEE